ncbi:Uncharacterized protein TCM_019320 [Theobroma cacao]|uniref:Uncharacterized protein n=1 Tax=Theobroma cacao TaxID=3641 RepID=A0A061EHC5_THECC|nr:Uncharacterized protein TCM_019320 [Theobroma cacao]
MLKISLTVAKKVTSRDNVPHFRQSNDMRDPKIGQWLGASGHRLIWCRASRRSSLSGAAPAAAPLSLPPFGAPSPRARSSLLLLPSPAANNQAVAPPTGGKPAQISLLLPAANTPPTGSKHSQAFTPPTGSKQPSCCSSYRRQTSPDFSPPTGSKQPSCFSIFLFCPALLCLEKLPPCCRFSPSHLYPISGLWRGRSSTALSLGTQGQVPLTCQTRIFRVWQNMVM